MWKGYLSCKSTFSLPFVRLWLPPFSFVGETEKRIRVKAKRLNIKYKKMEGSREESLAARNWLDAR